MKKLKLFTIACLFTLILTSCNITNSSANVSANTTAPEYTEYLDWNGYYEGGWMDTGLVLNLLSDYDSGQKCGTMIQEFRGNEFSGDVFYTDSAEFTFQINYADGSYEVYLAYPKMNGNKYELEIYDQAGKYQCTFTKEMTLKEYNNIMGG